MWEGAHLSKKAAAADFNFYNGWILLQLCFNKCLNIFIQLQTAGEKELAADEEIKHTSLFTEPRIVTIAPSNSLMITLTQ